MDCVEVEVRENKYLKITAHLYTEKNKVLAVRKTETTTSKHTSMCAFSVCNVRKEINQPGRKEDLHKKVKLSLCLTKYHTMKMYPVLN
jgi:hypothetical protein